MNTKRRLTKRQKKAQRQPNAMVQHSIKHGQPHGIYKGQPPIYSPIFGELNQIIGFKKVTRGVPFVRAAH